jgi:hypothetical protein
VDLMTALPMTALTVRAPWAWAIAAGYKTVENRTWVTYKPFPFDLAIHAAGRRVEQAAVDAVAALLPPGADVPDSLVTSAIVAVATITDCHPSDACRQEIPGSAPGEPDVRYCSPWALGGATMYHWTIGAVRTPSEPIPCKGALSLWRVPPDIAAELAARLPAPVGHP